MFENKSSATQAPSLKSMNGFNGGIAYFDLNGSIAKMDGYEKGLLSSTLPKSVALSPGTVESNVAPIDIFVGLDSYTRITSEGHGDNYKYSMQNSTIYLYSQRTSTHSIWVYQDSRGNPRAGSVVY
jgi:hypothetical protein